jgi:hypothetical protein
VRSKWGTWGGGREVKAKAQRSRGQEDQRRALVLAYRERCRHNGCISCGLTKHLIQLLFLSLEIQENRPQRHRRSGGGSQTTSCAHVRC